MRTEMAATVVAANFRKTFGTGDAIG